MLYLHASYATKFSRKQHLTLKWDVKNKQTNEFSNFKYVCLYVLCMLIVGRSFWWLLIAVVCRLSASVVDCRYRLSFEVGCWFSVSTVVRCRLLLSWVSVGCWLSMSAVVGILVAGGLRCVNFTNTVLMHVENVWVFCIAHYCKVLVYEPWRRHRLWDCSHKILNVIFPRFS